MANRLSFISFDAKLFEILSYCLSIVSIANHFYLIANFLSLTFAVTFSSGPAIDSNDLNRLPVDYPCFIGTNLDVVMVNQMIVGLGVSFQMRFLR